VVWREVSDTAVVVVGFTLVCIAVFILASKIGGGRSEKRSSASELYHGLRNERNDGVNEIHVLPLKWRGGFMQRIPDEKKKPVSKHAKKNLKTRKYRKDKLGVKKHGKRVTDS
jgi:hypothetical protein